MAKIENVITKDLLLLYNNQIDLRKANKTDIPKNTGDLFNNSDFQTASDVTTKVNDALQSSGFQKSQDVTNAIEQAAIAGDWQSEAEVQALIEDAVKDFVGVEYTVVDNLPSEGKPGVIYLKKNAGEADDYAEYIWIQADDGGRFEALGSITAPDLTGYLQTGDVTTAQPSDILAMFSD